MKREQEAKNVHVVYQRRLWVRAMAVAPDLAGELLEAKGRETQTCRMQFLCKR